MCSPKEWNPFGSNISQSGHVARYGQLRFELTPFMNYSSPNLGRGTSTEPARSTGHSVEERFNPATTPTYSTNYNLDTVMETLSVEEPFREEASTNMICIWCWNAHSINTK